MTSPTQFQQASSGLSTLAQQELVAYLATSPSPDALQAFYFALVAEYGSASASLAADYFDSRRAEAPVRPGFVAEVAEPAPRPQVEVIVRWASQSKVITGYTGDVDSPDRQPILSDPDSATVKSRLSGPTQRLVLQPGRETIANSVDRDPAKPRWARKPHGDTCAFCLMIASRGAVYGTKSMAARKFHNDCNCTPEPVWKGQELSFDPGEYAKAYAQARRAADSGSAKAVLSKMREQRGIR